jgi:glucose-6-phosphate 1-epimerase
MRVYKNLPETTMQLADLNQRYAIPHHLQFVEGEGGLVMAEIANSHSTARIALQGAHLVTWQPRGQEPVVWVSKFAKYAAGKSIRGGVPICWPWFGAHASDSNLPGHGYARTVMWEVLETKELPDGATYIRFGLIETDATRAQWPHPCSVQIEFTIGKTLRVELVTRNIGTQAFTLGEALHTYFHISDVGQITIRGLEGCDYMDKAGGASELRKQLGGIVIESEVDRVYMNTSADCVIEDRGLKRAIRIAKQGSQSTVVWNPWTEKADKMGDFGTQGHRGMVCVESANALENVVSVAPGAMHHLAVLYSVEALN